MTYALTVRTGEANVVVPGGRRCQGGDPVYLSDDEYSRLGPGGQRLFSPATGTIGAGYMGGDFSWEVTVADGKRDVVIPGGLRLQAGQQGLIDDGGYSTMGVGSAALFSAVQKVAA